MPQHHNLSVPGRLPAGQQREPAEHPDHDQVEQTKSHEPRFWPMCLAGQAAGHSPRAEFWSGTGLTGFTIITTPTPVQCRAFELLGVSHRLGYA
jgi:hypothetical protein